jgi:class 3 adenylate cyclase
MDTSSRTNRTWLCSVIFTDIVGYSIKSVSHQAQIKERFNAILASAIRSIPAQDRIILDTGDGAAICFLGDPEDVLFAALDLRSAFANASGDPATSFGVRIGVNLGPVKLVHDVNGSLNAVGDGINVAQRVMSFAEPNTVLVSRSFYEVVGCLSDEYEKMFHFEGTRKDKHVREHTVYALQIPEGATPPTARSNKAAPAPLPEELLQQMETELAKTLGPVAKVAVRRSAPTATSAGALAARLAEDYLEGAAKAAFVKKFAHDAEVKPAEIIPPAPVATALISGGLSVDTAPLEALLAEYIGPLARVLVKRTAAKTKTADELIDRLKDEIPAGKERAEFVKRAQKLKLD